MTLKEHTISMLVSNKPGTLIRIALIFSRRGCNIDNLVVSPSPDPRFSVMNITGVGNDLIFTNVMKQIRKLVDVVQAIETTNMDIIQRELALVKIFCPEKQRTEILQMTHALKCDIIDIDTDSIVLEVTGSSERVERIRTLLDTYGIKEWMRTGKVLMRRGQASHTIEEATEV